MLHQCFRNGEKTSSVPFRSWGQCEFCWLIVFLPLTDQLIRDFVLPSASERLRVMLLKCAHPGSLSST